MDGHTSRVFSVQYIPGQNYEFLSGGWDDTVQVLYAVPDIISKMKKIIKNRVI